jgi:hypothetical protein
VVRVKLFSRALILALPLPLVAVGLQVSGESLDAPVQLTIISGHRRDTCPNLAGIFSFSLLDVNINQYPINF